MKKVLILLLFVLAFFIVPNNLKAEVSTYKVYLLDDKSVKSEETIFNTYSEALTKMTSYPSDITKVAVIEKDANLVNARYATVKLKANGFVYMYSDAALTKNYTYIDGNYGVDAVLIDFDDANNTVKIKISGYSGWTSLNSVEIIPLSKIAKQYIDINFANTVLKEDHVESSKTIKTLQHHAPYIWDQKVDVNGIIWYHINESGTNGWVSNNNDSTKLTEEYLPFLNTYYVVFNDENINTPFDLRHYFSYRTSNGEKILYNNMGTPPTYLNNNQYYFSFDGNYFYTDFLKMIDDYKKNVYTNSLNKDNPYFNYYMYLPNHSKTGYTKENFDKIISDKYEAPDPTVKYVDDNGNWIYGVNHSNISVMYGQGINFIESQENYGVNALLSFSAAMNESGRGTSAIAFGKNNLFGHGATDDAPYKNATTYETVKDSIFAHASGYATSYSNPSDYRYFGSHYGNKGSGMGVKYASDPYWGEKMASHAYSEDLAYGQQDLNSNTIGIKLTNEDVAFKKEATDDSKTLYLIKNNANSLPINNVPFVIIDKVYDKNNNSWYKVYSDISLDSNREITTEPYKFSQSYGYIKSEYLYVSNKQPVINASDITIEQGIPYNILTNVTANDAEDGDLTSKIQYSPSIDITKYGIFYVTYTVKDSSNFNVSKTVKVTINKSNNPTINASDRTVLQNTNFDPLALVTVDDPNEGDITDKLKVINNVDISKVGTYKVTYSVTNSMKIEVKKEINVTVLSNAIPIIRANDVYMKVNESLNYLENASAIDLEDGILTDKIKLTHNIDKLKVGTYDLTYEITDSNNNKTSKKVNVFVEEDKYTTKKGELYFNTLLYNETTNLLDVSGSLAMIGIDNTKDTNINYDLIFKNNISGYEIIFPLQRYLDNHPTTIYGDTSKKYEETWFKGSIDLKKVIKGEYTLYVRARCDSFETKVLFNNLFLKNMTKKATDSDGRGYQFRNNNYSKEFPIELFVYENGLISTKESPSTANMFNNYSSIELKSKYLKISGNSFNINGDYNKNSNITRYLIFENSITEERYQYNIGSIIGEELVLRSNDGLSKARSWYDTKETVDITELPKGRYIIYIRTINSKVDDFGELQDIFLKATDSITINSKKYSLMVNNKHRFRVELLVE